MNNTITAAEVLGDGKVILVPVKVPMPSARVAAMLTTLTVLGLVGVAVAYTVGKNDGGIEAKRELEEEFQARMKVIEEKADARVEEIRRERGHSTRQHEART